MADDVVLTGVGVVSRLGSSLEELAARAAQRDRPRPSEGRIAVEDAPLDAVPSAIRSRLGRADRLCRFLASAAWTAVRDAGFDAFEDPGRVGLSFGTAYGCLATDLEFHAGVLGKGVASASPRLFAYTVSSAAAGEISIGLGIHGPNLTSHAGHAAGLAAVAEAAAWIRAGRADVVLAGGADVLGSIGLDALDRMDLAREGEGILPSEGAAVLVLESLDSATRRGAPLLARLLAEATGFEPAAPEGSRGIAGTLREILPALSGGSGAVLSSAAGLAVDRAERVAIDDVFGGAVVASPKEILGETFGAAGPLAAALASTGWPGGSSNGGSGAGTSVVTSVCPFGPVAVLALAAEPAGIARAPGES